MMRTLLLGTFLLIVTIHSISAQVVFSEIHYDPTGDELQEEFVEIVNSSSSLTIDISAYRVEDNNGGYTFGPGSFLAPGQAIAIAKNPATYPGSVGPAGFRLSNTGENIFLLDETGATIQILFFDSDDGGNNNGLSLQVVDATIVVASTNTNWVELTPTPNSYLGPLPVSLTSFTAEKMTQGAKLKWEVASQESNDFFGVEVSRDGNSFREVARINGDGTTHEAKTYSYEYSEATAGSYYFRLRQVDFDGAHSYSPIVQVDFSGKGGVTLYPVRDGILSAVFARGTTEVAIVSMTGAVVAKATPSPNGEVNVDVSALASGIYLITDGINTHRFVK